MKLYILFVFALIIFNAELHSQSDKVNFKTGKFTYSRQYIFNGDTLYFPNQVRLDTVKVVRSADIQTEYSSGTDQSVFGIRWVSDSLYILTAIKPRKGSFNIGETIEVKILSVNGNTYRYRSSSRIGTIECTMIKLGD
jgi:hypothetical protein